MNAIEMLKEKIAQRETEIGILRTLLGELEQQAEEPTSLRELTVQVLQENPSHRMSRRDIIREVKARRPAARHIGVVSALSNAEWFKKVGKDEFELK